MTESRERFIEMRQDLYRHAQPKPTTARCKYCGKAYPVGEMGCIGNGWTVEVIKHFFSFLPWAKKEEA